MPLDVDGGETAKGLIGAVGAAIGALATLVAAKWRRRETVESRLERWRLQFEASLRQENAELRERVAILESQRRGREVELENLRVVLRMVVLELHRIDPQSVILAQMRAMLTTAFPVTETPADMLKLLEELEARERGG